MVMRASISIHKLLFPRNQLLPCVYSQNGVRANAIELLQIRSRSFAAQKAPLTPNCPAPAHLSIQDYDFHELARSERQSAGETIGTPKD
jgi:hypothetical protein